MLMKMSQRSSRAFLNDGEIEFYVLMPNMLMTFLDDTHDTFATIEFLLRHHLEGSQ